MQSTGHTTTHLGESNSPTHSVHRAAMMLYALVDGVMASFAQT